MSTLRSRLFRSKERTEQLASDSIKQKALGVAENMSQYHYAWFAQTTADKTNTIYECETLDGAIIDATHLVTERVSKKPAPGAVLVGMVSRILRKKTRQGQTIHASNIEVLYNGTSRTCNDSTLGHVLSGLNTTPNASCIVYRNGDAIFSCVQSALGNLTYDRTSTYRIVITRDQSKAIAETARQLQDEVLFAVGNMHQQTRTLAEEQRRSFQDVRMQMNNVAAVTRQNKENIRSSAQLTEARIQELAKREKEMLAKLNTNKPTQQFEVREGQGGPRVPVSAAAPGPSRAPQSAATLAGSPKLDPNAKYMTPDGRRVDAAAFTRSLQAHLRDFRKNKTHLQIIAYRSLRQEFKSRAARFGADNNSHVVMNDGQIFCTAKNFQAVFGISPAQYNTSISPAPPAAKW